MKIIGLTGGIGTGKSTVARFLAELGAAVIDMDEMGHEVLAPNTETWQKVVEAFGQEIVGPDGTINREKLGKIVFNSAEARERLNRIVHPRMAEMVKARLEEYRRQGKKVVVIDAPLLIEVGWASLVDEVWATTASKATALRRLRERAGLSEKESLARVRSQLPSQEKLKHASVVIDTDCTLGELKAKTKELWRKIEQDQSTRR